MREMGDAHGVQGEDAVQFTIEQRAQGIAFSPLVFSRKKKKSESRVSYERNCFMRSQDRLVAQKRKVGVS